MLRRLLVLASFLLAALLLYGLVMHRDTTLLLLFIYLIAAIGCSPVAVGGALAG